jgi:hypothetical protein
MTRGECPEAGKCVVVNARGFCGAEKCVVSTSQNNRGYRKVGWRSKKSQSRYQKRRTGELCLIAAVSERGWATSTKYWRRLF